MEQLKKQMMEWFKQIGDNVKEMNLNPSVFIAQVEADVDTKYRQDIFKSLLKLGESEELTALLTMEVTLDVNKYDEDISLSFCNDVMLPMIKVSLKNKESLPIQKHLNHVQFLTMTAKSCSLKWQV